MAALAKTCDLRLIVPVPWTGWARWRTCVAEHKAVRHPLFWYTPGLLRISYANTYYWSVKLYFRRMLREFQPDLVYAPFAYPDGAAAVRWAREAGLPVVVKVMGSDL